MHLDRQREVLCSRGSWHVRGDSLFAVVSIELEINRILFGSANVPV